MLSIDSYTEFLNRKRIAPQTHGIDHRGELHHSLFGFQRDITRWALRTGRAAIFADCGMGKARMALEWARVIGVDTMIFAPLAVTMQFKAEAAKIGASISVCRTPDDVMPGINVTNYDRAHLFESRKFGAVILDESSILKHHDSKTRAYMTEEWGRVPYRLCCTATPAPNDHIELGSHAEFLGVMRSSEMLSMFFVHDGGTTQDWRLKGHAQQDFWAWVCTWAVNIRMPSDLGYDDGAFILPALRMHDHVVSNSDAVAKEAGLLFSFDSAKTLNEQRAARRESMSSRVTVAAELANSNEEQWLVWCDLNSESEMLAKSIRGAVEVRGSDSADEKEARLMGFTDGSVRVLVSKPSIAGWGMNWQNCHNAIYVGVSHSAEQWYQSIRRIYRFGQAREVECHVITSEAEGEVVKNLRRKLVMADEMAAGMIAHTKDITRQQMISDSLATSASYEPSKAVEMPSWIGASVAATAALDSTVCERHAVFHGDSAEVLAAIPDSSIHYSVFSPPFADLYVYSNSERDLGNCKSRGEFMEHFGFIVDQLFRVVMPGRLLSFHCMNLPSSKSRDGFIGITDFRGELIKLFQTHGWIYHSEVVIWKDPVTAMQRTKALGLLHKQIRKDSAMCRQGIPDYLVTMRKPGDNPERVSHTAKEFPVEMWQRYASPVWFDIDQSDTIQFRSAREHEDEKHICPLQLGVIRRAIELWTNPGDVVLSPFMGIGSEGYVSIEQDRRFIGIELKKSYYKQAVANIHNARKQTGLFE